MSYDEVGCGSISLRLFFKEVFYEDYTTIILFTISFGPLGNRRDGVVREHPALWQWFNRHRVGNEGEQPATRGFRMVVSEAAALAADPPSRCGDGAVPAALSGDCGGARGIDGSKKFKNFLKTLDL
jgi:hypothetical protein